VGTAEDARFVESGIVFARRVLVRCSALYAAGSLAALHCSSPSPPAVVQSLRSAAIATEVGIRVAASLTNGSALLFTHLSECRGKFWLGIRTACEPLFHSAALASYAPMMNAAADQLVDKLQKVADTGEGGFLACFFPKSRAVSLNGAAADELADEQQTVAGTGDCQGTCVTASMLAPLPACPPTHSPACLPAVLNISHQLKEMTLDVVGSTAFG